MKTETLTVILQEGRIRIVEWYDMVSNIKEYQLEKKKLFWWTGIAFSKDKDKVISAFERVKNGNNI